MRYEDHFTLKVDNFRAIKEATIGLNGITVVAGINGSGKSTLSKLLYHTFYVAEHLEELIVHKTWDLSLKPVAELFEYAEDFISSRNNRVHRATPPRKWKTAHLHDMRKVFSEGFNEFKYNLQLYVKDDSEQRNSKLSWNELNWRLRRLLEMAHSFLKINDHDLLTAIPLIPVRKDNSLFKTQLSDLCEKIENHLDDIFKQGEEALATRDISYFDREIAKAFHMAESPSDYSFYQNGKLITNREQMSMEKIFFVERVAYIDTPMIVGLDIDTSFPLHWQRLEKLLKRPSLSEMAGDDIIRLLKEDVMDGEVVRKKKFSRIDFEFVQKINNDEDAKYELLECATGIKSFAILQLLLENGFLDKRTLLILDEPETHLHPAWIVEYARLLVLLHKHHGVRFFIATHSPDMVSALKYIGENEMEDVEKRMGFYLAEKQENHRFVFKPQGLNIGKIHGSFNTAIKKTDEYGGLEEKSTYL